ncbi:MAG: TIGR02587 family membrane protein [Euryarchaeota archaeon]|nr:TIGR02587 family membrane protein [Euryarchaeota archaeon]
MSFRRELKDLGRGVAGALVFGTPFLLTMETWWLGWTLPPWLLLSTAFGAVLLVTALAWFAGFRKSEEKGGPQTVLHWVSETSEIILESLLAAYIVLSLYGVVDWGQPWLVVARIGLVEVVALALGAAVANKILASSEDGAEARPFPEKVALFALGALFFILHIATTDEMDLLAAHAGWVRLGAVLLVSVLMAHLVLFELEFRGQKGRAGDRSHLYLWGEGFLVLFIALLVSFLTLAGLGQFLDQPHEVWLQMTIVLALPATIGASAARVVVG